jgi:hypothetical membrane protein
LGKIRSALASGGVVGPAAFVAAWAVLGSGREGYSPVVDAISQLAEVGAPTRPKMTTAMILDGVGITTYGISLFEDGSRIAANCAIVAGIATLGAGAFPLGPPLSGRIHGVFAVVGYAGVVATPIAAAPGLWRQGRRRVAALAVLTGAVSGALLFASLRGGPRRGLLQRAGLTVGDVWIAASAIERVRFG